MAACREAMRSVRGMAATGSGVLAASAFRAMARLGPRAERSSPGPDPLRRGTEELSWRAIDVDGAAARYAVGGEGPPVLFLHGWGLGSTAYKRALRRLVRRGCYVIAPAMPGFGGTDPLPVSDVSIAGYADWVDRFLTEIGLAEPALVLGHSFGGGVATMLTHRHSSRVRYLVLINAVGASQGDRSLADWGINFVSDLFPLVDGLEALAAMGRDLVTNLVRDPVSLVRAGHLARAADLTVELSGLRAGSVPVLALSSEQDGIIPDSAFTVLCDAVGAEGRRIAGGHCWLLADPDAFDEVLSDVVEVEVQEHRRATASARVADVSEILSRAGVANRSVRRFLESAPPLWLMSASPVELAADLALCRRRLRSGEVRAVALPIDDGPRVRLTVVAPDRRGLLADHLAVLAEEEISVLDAAAATWPQRRVALHSLTLDPERPISEARWHRLGEQLRRLTTDQVPVPDFEPADRARVTVNGTGDGRAVVTVTARDRLGLLWAICRWFADHDASIESLHAVTDYGVAIDSFIVAGTVDTGALADHLSASHHLVAV